MTRLVWDDFEDRVIESGITQGVLYPESHPIEVWNGLRSIDEKPESETQAYYQDGNKRFDKALLDDFSASLESFTYPSVLDEEKTKYFGFTYRSYLSNGSYRLHLVYNPSFRFSNYQYESLGDQQDATPFIWEMYTKPEFIPGYAPTSHLILEPLSTYSSSIDFIEDILYGTDIEKPFFPSAEIVAGIIENTGEYDALLILDHGTGLWTAIGPESMITLEDDNSFAITSESAILLDLNTYTISSF